MDESVAEGGCLCGAVLTYEHAARASEVDVTTRRLDNSDLFPPSHHSWVSDAPHGPAGRRTSCIREGQGQCLSEETPA